MNSAIDPVKLEKFVTTIKELAKDIKEGVVVPGQNEMWGEGADGPCCTMGHLYSRMGIPEDNAFIYTSTIRLLGGSLGDATFPVDLAIRGVIAENDCPLIPISDRPQRLADALHKLATTIEGMKP